jgi:hypothetical protein
MSTKTQNQNANLNAQKVQTFAPELSPKVVQQVAKALDNFEASTRAFNVKVLSSGKDAVLNYTKRAKILDFIKEQTKLKYAQLSELCGISERYIKAFAQLSKAINNAEPSLSVDNFLRLNEQRLATQKETKYTIYALIDYLNAKDIFADKDLQKISDKEEAKEQTKANKTQTKAQTKAQTNEPKADANRQTFVFNPVLFGFDSKEDITLNITHSPKNKAKPYLVVSNVSSAVLRSMFEKVLRELSKCEKDAEQIAKFEIESETELADNVTLDTFESEFIQVRR